MSDQPDAADLAYLAYLDNLARFQEWLDSPEADAEYDASGMDRGAWLNQMRSEWGV